MNSKNQEEIKLIKAQRIHAIVRDVLKNDLSHYACLDIGCAQGIITNYLADFFKEVHGIDINQESIKFAQEHFKKPKFRVASALQLPFKDESFDVVIASQIYNYLEDQAAFVKELYRVMKKDSICYFSAVNKFVKDPHNIKTKPLSYKQLKILLKDFKIDDYTLEVLYKYESHDIGRYNFLRIIPKALLKQFIFLAPSWIFILRKK